MGITIAFRVVQYSKARLPMTRSDVGRVTVVRALLSVQGFDNDKSMIEAMVYLNYASHSKAFSPMYVTDLSEGNKYLFIIL